MNTMQRASAVFAMAAIALLSTSAHALTHRQGPVYSYASKFYSYSADPGELFRVRISGDGDSDVDLFIRDDDGRVVCSRTGPIDEETCTLRSRSGGTYYIEVRNVGDIMNVVDLYLE